MFRKCRRFPILCAVAFSASCGGVSQQAVRTSSVRLPPRPAGAEVHIYRAGQTPDYPFEEVGIVSARKTARSAFGSAKIIDLIPVLQDQARDLGADAIIIQDANEYLSSSLNGSATIPAASVSGIAIHYVKAIQNPTVTLARRPTTPAAVLTTEELVAHAAPSVVQIETDASQGSGVVISPDGLILTNEHVIRGASAIIVKFADGRRSVAAVQAVEPNADIALIKVSLDSLVPILIGASSTVVTGSEVVVIGSPLGLAQTVSKGIVSSVRESDGRTLIQTDASVSPGNSGCPLLNSRGEVIGIISFKLAQPLSEGLNFALAIDDALIAVGVRFGR